MLISRHVFCDKRDEEITFKRHTKITQQQPKSWKIIKSSQSQVKTASSQKSPPTQHDEDQPCFPSAFSSCRSNQFFSSEFITNFMDHFEKIFLQGFTAWNHSLGFLNQLCDSSGIHCLHVETTPAREVCTAFECPNDNEEGGLFQVDFMHNLNFYRYIYDFFFPFDHLFFVISVGTLQPRVLRLQLW